MIFITALVILQLLFPEEKSVAATATHSYVQYIFSQKIERLRTETLNCKFTHSSEWFFIFLLFWKRSLPIFYYFNLAFARLHGMLRQGVATWLFIYEY